MQRRGLLVGVALLLGSKHLQELFDFLYFSFGKKLLVKYLLRGGYMVAA